MIFVAIIALLPIISILTVEGSTNKEDSEIIIWDSDIVISEDFYVFPGQTLRIQPGIIVKLDKAVAIFIEGTIIAEGTDGNPITFTTNKIDSYWDKIYIDTRSKNNVIKYCDIHFANIGIYCLSTADILNNSIHHNLYAGIVCGPNARPRILYNSITANGIGIVCESGTQPEISINVIMDNTEYNIKSYCENTTIIAEYNYWGYHERITIQHTLFGDIDFDPWLDENPLVNEDKNTITHKYQRWFLICEWHLELIVVITIVGIAKLIRNRKCLPK
jgi:hypothetical protein